MLKKTAVTLTIIFIFYNHTFASPYIPNFAGTWEGLCSLTNPDQKKFKEILQISQNNSSGGETEIMINDESYAIDEIETDVHSNVKTGGSTNEITYTHWDAVKNELINSTVKVSKLKSASRLSIIQDEWVMKLDNRKLVIVRRSTGSTEEVTCVYENSMRK